jgi:hypothetical protein
MKGVRIKSLNARPKLDSVRVAGCQARTTCPIEGFVVAPVLSVDVRPNKSYCSENKNSGQVQKGHNVRRLPKYHSDKDGYSQQQETLPLVSVKIEGVEPITCIFCDQLWYIEFDLSQHLREEHKTKLKELPIGKGSFDKVRIPYAIDKGRSKPKPVVSTSIPNFDRIDSELLITKNHWIQANRRSTQQDRGIEVMAYSN